MKLAHVFTCLSAVALAACAADDSQAVPSEAPGEGRADAAALDPLGVDLVAAGLSAGDTPCGDDAHVASVTDEAGRYLAFCVAPSGDTSVLQITPGGVEPLGAPSGCALDTFLAAAPAGTPVPRALVAACKGAAPPARRLSDEPVAVIATPVGIGGIGVLGPCQSATVFTNVQCDAIDDFTSNASVADSVSWCSVGPLTGVAQRTASSQGLPDALQGRLTVAACGTATTNLKGQVKRGISGTWVVPSGDNVNVSPNHVATRDIYTFDVVEYDDFDTPFYGSDLRFIVTASEGAWFRYTGAYVEYFPVP